MLFQFPQQLIKRFILGKKKELVGCEGCHRLPCWLESAKLKTYCCPPHWLESITELARSKWKLIHFWIKNIEMSKHMHGTACVEISHRQVYSTRCRKGPPLSPMLVSKDQPKFEILQDHDHEKFQILKKF